MKILLMVFALGIITNKSFSQIEFRNLNEVFVYADENNISLQKAELNKQAVATSVSMAKADLLPRIIAFGSAGYDPIIPSQAIPARVFFGLITTLFAGYFPSKKASKIDPVQIIRG